MKKYVLKIAGIVFYTNQYLSCVKQVYDMMVNGIGEDKMEIVEVLA